MAPRENEQVVRNWFEAYNHQDIDAIMELCAADFTAVYPDLARHGRGKWRDLILHEFEAFPNARLDNLRLIAHGDRVAAELDWSATQMREFLGRPASQRTYEFPCILLFDLDSARITEIRY